MSRQIFGAIQKQLSVRLYFPAFWVSCVPLSTEMSMAATGWCTMVILATGKPVSMSVRLRDIPRSTSTARVQLHRSLRGPNDAAVIALSGDGQNTRTSKFRNNLSITNVRFWPLPTNASDKNGERLLTQQFYIVWYDADLRTPLWTAHLLTKEDVTKKLKRADSFRSDPHLADGERSECVDYDEPIVDQGHMVPNGDMTRSNIAMDETFLMSNMTPQHCAFNRGVWQVLEQRIRAWAAQVENTWVITGAVFDRKSPIGRDPDEDAWRMKGKAGRRVAIPSAQYKIVIRQKPGGYETLNILLPNNDILRTKSAIPKYIAGHVTTLDAIAQRGGFRFLQNKQSSWP